MRIIIFLSSLIGLSAQNHFRAEHYTIQNGLTQGFVTDFHQDKRGFIWLATGDGLNRFDGYEFLHFGSNPKDSTSLSHRIVTKIEEDEEGHFWVGSRFGLNKFNPKTKKSERFYFNGDETRTVFAMRLNQTNLWIGAQNGFFNFDIKTYKTKEFFLPDSLKFIRSIVQKNESVFYLATTKGLIEYNTITERFISISPPNLNQSYVRAVFLDLDGTLWISYAFGGGTHCYNTTNNKFITNPIAQDMSSFYVTNIYAHTDHLFFSTTTNGVYKYNKQSKQRVAHFNEQNQLLVNNSAQQVFIDKQNTLWISTFERGISKISQTSPAIRAFKGELDIPFSNIYYLFEDSDLNLWIATGRGVFQFDPKTEKINSEITIIESVPHILEDDQFVWFLNNPVMAYDKYKQQVLQVSQPERMWHLQKISDDSLCFFGENDVWNYNHKTKQFEKVDFPKELTKNKFSCLIYTSDAYWYISNGVLNKFDKRTKTLQTFNREQDPKDVFELFCIDETEVWLSSNYGVYRFFYNDGSFVHYTTKDGMSNNVSLGILKDRFQNYWISTNNGILSLSPSNEFTAYYKANGLPANEYTFASLKGKNGDLYFGGYGGFVKISPEKLMMEEKASVLFSSLGINNTRYTYVLNDSEWEVAYTSNALTLHLSTENYKQQKRNIYAYKLGSDEWKTLENLNTLTLVQLPYGQNKVSAKVKPSGGQWSDESSIYVFVKAPFWKQWWFYSFCGIVFIGLVYGLYLLRLRQMKRLHELRLKVASDLHDDVGSTLTKISLMIDFTAESEDTSEIKNILTNVSSLSRKTVASMSDIVWAIDVRNDKLGDLIARMEDYISELRQKSKLSVKLFHNGFPPDKKITLTLRKNIYLIFKEAVTNTLKYANATEIEINLENRKQFKMKISHNGIVESVGRQTGHGIRNMHERAKSSNLSLVIDELNGYFVDLSGQKL